MTTSAVINISQFETEDEPGQVRQFVVSFSNYGNARQIVPGLASSSLVKHLDPVTQPLVRRGANGYAAGWPTSDKEDWSDSPTNQPYLLYRHRFSWGRDEQELFSYRGLDPLPIGDFGQRWGNMDIDAGVLTYLREFPLESSASIHLFRVKNSGKISQRRYDLESDFTRISELGKVTGENNVYQFPFLLVAKPEPFSIKNPVDTDVYIRMANFTFPISSGTITLYLDGAIQPDLEITEFFGGLGGFDVTWHNTFNFDYDAQVNVRWEFRDTDVPSNKFVLGYPFYVVPDYAAPRVFNLIPADQATGVPLTGPIQFDIEDFENDVDIDSLVLYVNNVLIVDGENGTIEVFRLLSEQGYTVRFTPNKPWLYGDLIPVAVFVKDTSVNQNERFFTYSFTTIESEPPRLINLRPLACSLAVPVGTDISVDVIDGGHGLDKDSIVFTVEDIERSGQIALIPIVHRDD